MALGYVVIQMFLMRSKRTIKGVIKRKGYGFSASR